MSIPINAVDCCILNAEEVSIALNVQFEQLRSKMLEIDKRAVTERSFWKDEFEIILTLRQEFLDRGPGIDPFAEFNFNPRA